jgi:hypothetical protein
MMLSNLVASLKDIIKSETELYTMRIQQQLNRHCAMIESAGSMQQHQPTHINYNDNNNYQEQLDSIKESIAMILNELYRKNYNYDDLNEPASPISESNIDDIESDEPIIVNKLPSEEVKMVHIDLLNSTIVEEHRSDTPVLDKKEIIIENKEFILISNALETNNIVDDTTIIQDTNVSVVNEPVIEKVIQATVENAVEEVEEEEEEVEEQDLEVEEIEYKGVKYYKDSEGTVYQYTEDGDVGEAVGTMSKKIPGKVLLYST